MGKQVFGLGHRVGSQVWVALASAALGALLSGLLASEVRADAPLWLLLLGLVLAAAAAAACVSRLSDVEAVVRSGLSGVRMVEVPQQGISEIAIRYIEHATTIRVIGTARHEALVTQHDARRYLQSTERRARQHKGFTYRRITAQGLSPEMEEHLGRLRKIASTRSRSVQVRRTPSLAHAISYQVFDESAALIIVDCPTAPGSVDNRVCWLTTDADVVYALIFHFDNAWRDTALVDDGLL